MKKAIPMVRNVFDAQSPRKIKSVDNVFGNFLASKGLYDEIEITKDNVFELADLVGGYVKIDVYCPKCGESRVFLCEKIPYYWYEDQNREIKAKPLETELVSWQLIQSEPRPHVVGTPEEPWTWTNNSLENDTRLMVFKFSCAMDNTHHLDYVVLTHENKMMKIGQYPSVADLSFPELKYYRKVMTKEDERELKRAIGLFASGIGVGSFVYLRRIFERIIMTASQKAIEDGKIKEDEFIGAHINEKIKMLAEYLPPTLVNSPVFYGIISKGIHELSEEDCIEFFPVMQSFIMMILRQWEQVRKDKEEEKKLAVSLGNIAGKLK